MFSTGESDADGVIEADTLTPTTCRYETRITAEGYETASLGEIDVPEDDGMTVELQPAGESTAARVGWAPESDRYVGGADRR